MSHNWIQTFISFIILLLLQEFVFDNIELSIYINIYIYVMFILLLPANYSPLVVLLLSGLMGLTVDVFSGGILGLNMAACLAMGFARPYILKMVTSSSDAPLEIPVVHKVETRKVLAYTVILVFIHHFILFSLEAFSFSKLVYILLRTLVSTAVTSIFILISEMLLYSRK